VEIAFFDRGPLDAAKLIVGGYWSTYWYNGFIYGSEIARGVDVFELKPSEWLSANEIAAAKLVQMNEFNAQSQPKMGWPNVPVVARAYMDQLTRSKSLKPEQAAELDTALTAVERASATDRAVAVTALDALLPALEKQGGSANPIDAAKYRAMVATMKAYVAAPK
jgi:hypothetical protein